KHVAAGTRVSGTRLTCIKSPEVDSTTQTKVEKWIVNSQAWPKSLKLPSGGNVTDQPSRPKSSKNKAINKWPTSKEESLKIEKIWYNLNRSQKDLNYPQLYKQGASPPQDMHSLNLPHSIRSGIP
ncbi:hypothetical protein PIB30_102959, partial [Stylosanthes scabra]|nr:hypothetical protein [Stylosanthes scabra]